MNQFSAFTRKLIAWGLVILLLLLVVSQVALPLWDTYENANLDIALKRDHLSRLVNQNKRLSDDLGDTPVSDLGAMRDTILLESSDSSSAAAEMRDYLSAALEKSGGSLQSTQNVTHPNQGTLQPNVLRVAMSASIEQLFDLLYMLESQQPFLYVDSLNLQAPGAMQRSTQDQPLRIQLNIVGYTMDEAPS